MRNSRSQRPAISVFSDVVKTIFWSVVTIQGVKYHAPNGVQGCPAVRRYSPYSVHFKENINKSDIELHTNL